MTFTKKVLVELTTKNIVRTPFNGARNKTDDERREVLRKSSDKTPRLLRIILKNNSKKALTVENQKD